MAGAGWDAVNEWMALGSGCLAWLPGAHSPRTEPGDSLAASLLEWVLSLSLGPTPRSAPAACPHPLHPLYPLCRPHPNSKEPHTQQHPRPSCENDRQTSPVPCGSELQSAHGRLLGSHPWQPHFPEWTAACSSGAVRTGSCRPLSGLPELPVGWLAGELQHVERDACNVHGLGSVGLDGAHRPVRPCLAGLHSSSCWHHCIPVLFFYLHPRMPTCGPAVLLSWARPRFGRPACSAACPTAVGCCLTAACRVSNTRWSINQ